MTASQTVAFPLNEPEWKSRGLHCNVAADCVDLWLLDLDAGIRQPHEGVLDGFEKARAARFLSPVKRRLFTSAHCQVRCILGRYTGLPPEGVTFEYSESGKPGLVAADGSAAVHFNLTHSGNRALVAVAPFQVGVDIEQMRYEKNIIPLARYVMSEEDLRRLEGKDPPEQTRFFYLHWTLLEALAKARGEGLISMLGARAPLAAQGSFVKMVIEAPSHNIWHARPILPAPGYAGAVAAEQSGWNLRFYRLSQRRCITSR